MSLQMRYMQMVILHKTLSNGSPNPMVPVVPKQFPFTTEAKNVRKGFCLVAMTATGFLTPARDTADCDDIAVYLYCVSLL